MTKSDATSDRTNLHMQSNEAVAVHGNLVSRSSDTSCDSEGPSLQSQSPNDGNHSQPIPRNHQDLVLERPILCTDCRVWHQPSYLFRRMTEGWEHNPPLRPLRQMLDNAEHCAVCSLISSCVTRKLEALGQHLLDPSHLGVYIGSAFFNHPYHSYSYKYGFIAMEGVDGVPTSRPSKNIDFVLYAHYHDITQKDDPYMLLRSRESARHWAPPNLPIPLSVSYNDTQDVLTNILSSPNNSYLDPKLIKNWISTCEATHRRCQLYSPVMLPDGFMVIDLKHRCITRISRQCRFVALSYVWSQLQVDAGDLHLRRENMDTLGKPGGLKPELLPQLLKDIFWLCQCLGERYLWLDRLCIVQDDSLSKHAQIKAMDAIYSQAVFTIAVVLDGKHCHGLPGATGHPRKPSAHNEKRLFNVTSQHLDFDFHNTVDNSAWNKRGWTFQERLLSRRCLFITDHQMYFTCANVLIQEDIGCVTLDATRGMGLNLSDRISNIQEVDCLQFYKACVADYTSRDLSYEADRLKAFNGVSNALAPIIQSEMFYGLPEKYFLRSLLWDLKGTGHRHLGDDRAPSWTWAGWTGAVEYKNSKSNLGALACPVKFYFSPDGKYIRPMLVDEDWKFEGTYLSMIERLKSAIPIAPYTSSATDPDEGQLRATLGELGPNRCTDCLVFRTTCAKLVVSRSSKTFGVAPGHRVLDLRSEAGELIGWMEGDLNLDSGQTKVLRFVVLCAQRDFKRPGSRLASSRSRSASRHPLGGPSSTLQLPTTSKRPLSVPSFNLKLPDQSHAPWLLRVLAVEESGGLSHRVGLGAVREKLWERADPRWETVILA